MKRSATVVNSTIYLLFPNYLHSLKFIEKKPETKTQ